MDSAGSSKSIWKNESGGTRSVSCPVSFLQKTGEE